MRFLLFLLSLPLLAQYPWFTVGEQRTLVAVLGGSSADAARERVFGATGSVDHFFREASNGQTWFVGDAVAVPWSGGNCSDLWGSFKASADAAVSKVVNLDNYTRLIYVIATSNTFCSFIGSSSIGITYRSTGGTLQSHTWLNGLPNQQVINHEVGHGMGLWHAGTYSPRTNTGDPADVMGGGGHTLNAVHKERMQWVQQSQVLSTTQPGTFTLTPLETPAGLKIVKIPRPADLGYDKTWLYVSYRQPIGTYNANMSPGLTRGVSVHVALDLFPAMQSAMLDSTPGSPDFFNDAALSDGACLYDPVGRFLIRQLSHSSSGATFSFTPDAGDPGCVAAPPPPPPPPPPTGCVPIGKSGKCR